MAPKCNDICGYTTPRVVRIKDWRLGVMNFTLMLIIAAYVGVWTIVINQRYRVKALDVVGSTRLQLHTPVPAYYIYPNQTIFCGNGTTTYAGQPVPQYPCRYYDQYDAVDPFLEQGAMFVTSRISSYEQTLPDHCTNQPTPDCQYVNGANNTFYIGNVEMMTLLLDHTFSSASLGVAQSAMSMPGKLLDQNGNAMNPCDDYTEQGWVCDPHVKIGLVNQGADVMPLRTLLRAAGINSLEETSPAIKETHRYAGLILVVSVQYSNAYLTTKSFLEGYYTYTYTVQSVQDAEFKAEQIIPLPGSGAVNRTILDRHGLRVLVKQSGDIGAFDFATLLVSLTSSMGLLAVASLVVDVLATSVLPLRAVYRQYKKIDSVSFPDVHLSKGDLRRFEHEDLINPAPRFLRKLTSAAGSSLNGHSDGLLQQEGDADSVADGGEAGYGQGSGAHLYSPPVPQDANDAYAAAAAARAKAAPSARERSAAAAALTASRTNAAYGVSVVPHGSAATGLYSPGGGDERQGLLHQHSQASLYSATGPTRVGDAARRASGISLKSQQARPLPNAPAPDSRAGSVLGSPAGPAGYSPVGHGRHGGSSASVSGYSTYSGGAMGLPMARPPMESIASAGGASVDSDE